MRKNIAIIGGLFLLAALSCPGNARAGILEFLFPTLKESGADPSKTLQAPFAHNADPARQFVAPVPENMVPLDQAHTSPAQLAEWVSQAVSELMTLDPADAQGGFSKNAGYFSEAGLQQYRDFLTQNNIKQTLEAGQYHVGSVVSEIPLLLNEGVVDGRYRWLYEVPVMTTYLERNVKTYKKAKPVNHNFSLVVQVGRMEKAVTGQAVVIERWTLRAPQNSKK